MNERPSSWCAEIQEDTDTVSSPQTDHIGHSVRTDVALLPRCFVI